MKEHDTYLKAIAAKALRTRYDPARLAHIYQLSAPLRAVGIKVTSYPAVVEHAMRINTVQSCLAVSEYLKLLGADSRDWRKRVSIESAANRLRRRATRLHMQGTST